MATFYFKDLFLFVLFSFLLSLSLFLCSWTCSPMQDCTDLALLKASSSDELWKKLHVYIWNCSKVTVSMVSLLLVYSSSRLSNLPGARACSWRTVLHLFRDLMASLFAFSLKKRGFILLVVSQEDFSWLKKQALCWANVFQSSIFKHCKLEQM